MMHSGEEFFVWGWPQYALIAALIGCYLLLSFRNKLPGMQAFKDFLDAINSAGGHIFLLVLLSVWSIKIAMQFFYHLLSLGPEQFDKDSALITAGITFVQGSLCGTFIGALIKTMSGGKANGSNGALSSSTPNGLSSPVAPSGIAGVSLSDAGAVPAVTGSPTAPAGKSLIGFHRPGLGEVGDRGDHGDLGTNNRL